MIIVCSVEFSLALGKFNDLKCTALQLTCNTVQISAVQCSVVQCNSVQCSELQCSAVPFSSQGGTFGILEYLSQSNDNANIVEEEDRFKFVDDLTIEVNLV